MSAIYTSDLHPQPAPRQRHPLVTYVDDIRTAMSEAKRAAGDENVLVHGAGIAQLALDELERTRILAGEGGVTHMHYRVRY